MEHNLTQITAAYYTGTGRTELVVMSVARRLGERLSLPVVERSYATPYDRRFPLTFSPTELAVVGSPTYAGRVPNLMLPYLNTIQGSGTLAVPIVTFGNRAFDNSLIELRDLLEQGGCRTIGAAAFACQHAFSEVLGKGRPDAEDMGELLAFADALAEKLLNGPLPDGPIPVEGKPGPDYGGYFAPHDRNGVFIDIRKVKPLCTDACTQCGLCAELCPMGAIDPDDCTLVPGKCVKCGGCVKFCPLGAKYFEDPGYLYHKEELELMYARRADNAVFL